jgi:hypothetical protein
MVVRIHRNANSGVRSPGIVICMKAANEIERLVSAVCRWHILNTRANASLARRTARDA